MSKQRESEDSSDRPPKTGNRHRQRRKYRSRRDIVARSLMIVDSRDNIRAAIQCFDGDQPSITLFDALGNRTVVIELVRSSVECGNGEGFVSVEIPRIRLCSRNAETILHSSEIVMRDEFGESSMCTIYTSFNGGG